MRGMNRAFEKVFGVKNALAGLTLSGMTDRIIFKNACEKVKVPFSEPSHDAFKKIYQGYLAEEIERPNAAKRMLPGVQPLLEKLQESEAVKLGLLTGNYAQCAKIKLGHFGIDHYFEFGAYGDDDEDRNKLLPFAIERLKKRFALNGHARSTWIIGDTPKDVYCARPHSAKAIAVATGDYNQEELAAARPDAIMQDLSDSELFFGILKKDD